jgi:hypothetical protein
VYRHSSAVNCFFSASSGLVYAVALKVYPPVNGTCIGGVHFYVINFWKSTIISGFSRINRSPRCTAMHKAHGLEPADINWWLDTMKKNRPVLLQARELLTQSDFQRRAVKAGHLPTISASGGYWRWYTHHY